MIHQEPDALNSVRPVLRGGKPGYSLPITTHPQWQAALLMMLLAFSNLPKDF